jgi:hypothetical protein
MPARNKEKKVDLMKWFKHLAGSLKDSIIFEAVTKFQGDGYLVFFGTLELMADEFDIYHPDTVTIPIKKMTSFFQLSRQKTLKILAFFDEKAKMFQRENKSFFAEINNTHVTIICKRFAALADNHTTTELAKANKLLVSDKQVTSPQDIKKEDNTDKEDNKDKKKKKKAHPPLPEKIEYKPLVFLTEDEHKKLVEKYGHAQAEDFIDQFSMKLNSKFIKYDSQYITILLYDRKGWLMKGGNNGSNQGRTGQNGATPQSKASGLGDGNPYPVDLEVTS